VREVMDRRVGVVVTAVVVALIVAGGPWVMRPPGAPAARTSPTPAAGATPRVSPTPTPSFELTVELGRVSGRGPDGRVRAGRLAGPAEAVLGTMTELYSAGFVDPPGGPRAGSPGSRACSPQTCGRRRAPTSGSSRPWLLAGTRHLRTDLTIRDMLDLGLAAPRVDPSRVRNAVVPGRVGSAGGRSLVHLGDPARAMFLDLARDGVLGR
jgi:hypothetical protein